MNLCAGPVFGSARSASRRDFLRRAGGGFGLLALTSLLDRDGLLAANAVTEKPLANPNPLAPRPPHHTPRARAVIFLFMSGGPSHVDLFDPKPDLIRLAGQPIPVSFGAFKTRRNVAKNNLFPPLRPFHKHGQSGIEVSDLLPHLAGQPIPVSFGAFKTRRNVAKNNLFPPLRPFHKHGQSGIEVSDLLPHLAGHVD